MAATMPQAELDPAYAAGGATDIEVAAAIADVNAALADHAAGDATDAELAAAVATLNASVAAKQDAATAATDAEVAAAIASIFATAPTAQLVAGFDVARHHTGAKPILVSVIGGVASDPGENGHIYFETSPDGIDWASFQKLSYVACRNRIENLGQVGAGGTVWGIVKPGHYWRYRTYTATGYATPEFIMDTGFEYVYRVAT